MATTCFVNPADPTEAVLSREFSVDLWFGVWPLIMVLLGAAGMVEAMSNRKVRFGRPEAWGRLALWSSTYLALLVLQAMGTDLVRDMRAGTADWVEATVVLVAGSVAAVPVVATLRLAHRGRRAGRSHAPVPAREVVEINDVGVTRRLGTGKIEGISWDDLVEVSIVTTDDGPWAEDVFFVLVDRQGKGCIVPQEAPGSATLLERLQRLPGFDNQAVIQAMGSTEDARLVRWRSPTS